MGIYAELFKMAADLFSAAAERGVENRVPEEETIRELCEFELANNKVGYRKKTAPVGFGIK
jgi:hypothetical protein